MTTSKEALALVRGKTVSLSKKTVTPDQLKINEALQNQLQTKLNDKLSSPAKSLSSASQSSAPLTLDNLTKNLSSAGTSQLISQTMNRVATAAAGKLTKGINDKASKVLQSKVSGLLGGQLGALMEGESLINKKLAPTVVTTGANDDLLTVDAYGQTPRELLTKGAGGLMGLGDSLLGSVGTSGLARQAASLLKLGAGGKVGLDLNTLKDRVIGSLGGRSGALNTLGGSLLGTVGQIAGINPALMQKAQVVIDGASRSINSGDIRSASGLFELVGTVINDSGLVSFFDLGAKTSLLTQLYREAIDLGVPEAIDIIISKADNNDRSAVYALAGVIDDAVDYGSVPVMQTMIDKLGPDAVLAKRPSTVSELLSTYVFPGVANDTTYQGYYTDLKAVLDSLNPTWGYIKRGAVNVVDLGLFTNVSEDARLLLNRYSPFVDALMISENYPSTTLVGLAREMYPMTVF